MKTCTIDRCEKPAHARTWCSLHYNRWLKHGDPSAAVRHKSPRRAVCNIDDCEAISSAKGYCGKHYRRWKTRGDANAEVRVRYAAPAEALAGRSRREAECLVWTGHINEDGYGRLSVKGKLMLAHRYVWEQQHGPIPEGMEVDHTCWNRACIAPQHLRLATRQQNVWNQSGAHTHSKTGVRGVIPSRNGKSFHALVAGEHLGTFDTIPEASVAAQAKRAELFGDYAGAS